jgi:hypothetical protein
LASFNARLFLAESPQTCHSVLKQADAEKAQNWVRSELSQYIVGFGSEQIIYEVMCSGLFRGNGDMPGVRGGDL